MERSDAIAVETGSGVVIAVDDGGGWTEMVKETPTTVAGGNRKKETIEVGIEKSSLDKKDKKMMNNKAKKLMPVLKVVSGETSAADETAMEVAMRSDGGVKGCRILVSNTKKPLLFYLNLAKRYIKQNNYVELSALGRAIPTVVTIAEILKKDGWATEKDITISSVPLNANGRVLMKAKFGILLEKTEKFDKNGLVVAKGASEICENKTEEFSSETNGEVFEDANQHLSVTNGTLTEKNAKLELIEG